AGDVPAVADIDLGGVAAGPVDTAEMDGIGAGHAEARLVHDVGKRLDVHRLVAGRIGIGDIAGDGRLAGFRAGRMAGGKIEKVNGSQILRPPLFSPKSRQAILPEAGARSVRNSRYSKGISGT